MIENIKCLIQSTSERTIERDYLWSGIHTIYKQLLGAWVIQINCLKWFLYEEESANELYLARTRRTIV